MKKYTLALFLTLSSLFAAPIEATSPNATTRPPTKILTLKTFSDIILESHPFVHITTHEYLAAIKENAALRGTIKDINLFASYLETKGQNAFIGTDYSKDTKITQRELGLTKLINQTGTRLSVSSTLTGIKDQPAIFGQPTPDNYKNSIDIAIKQPLLENAFGKLDRYPIKITHLTSTLAELKYKEDLEDFIQMITAEFASWRLSYIKMNIYKKQVEKSQEQVAITQRQHRRGAAEKLDLTQAKQSLKIKEILYKQQKSIFESLSSAIVKITGKDPHQVHLLPDTSPINAKIPKHQDAITYAYQNSNLLKLLTLNEDINALTLNTDKNKTLPSLDLIAVQRYSGNEASKSALNDNLTKHDGYTIGAEFSMPLTNAGARHQAKASEEQLKKAQQEKFITLLYLEIDITKYYIELAAINDLIQETKELVKLSEENESLERQKYTQGRANSLFFVLLAEENRLSAELQLEELKTQKTTLETLIQNLVDQLNPKETPRA